MTDQTSDSLSVQFGGDHYKQMAIEPVEYIDANGIPYLEGSAIKYLSRHQAKNGAVDLKKAIHFAVIALERRYGVKTEFRFVDPVKECDTEKSKCTVKITGVVEQRVRNVYPEAFVACDYKGRSVIARNSTEGDEILSEFCNNDEETWQFALDRIQQSQCGLSQPRTTINEHAIAP